MPSTPTAICPSCNYREALVTGKKNIYGIRILIVFCTRCGYSGRLINNYSVVKEPIKDVWEKRIREIVGK